MLRRPRRRLPGVTDPCTGWPAHDLPIHVWLIKRDPLSWAGMVVPGLTGLITSRVTRVGRRWPYTELVARLQADPGAIDCMPLDRSEGRWHALGECYVRRRRPAVRGHALVNACTPQDVLDLEVRGDLPMS